MEKEQVYHGQYKKNKFDGRFIIIIFLLMALGVSLFLNYKIIEMAFKVPRYFNYISSLEKLKNEQGFDKLTEINPSFEAWLSCEDVSVSMPVVKALTPDDEQFYLTHDIKKDSNALGNPFIKPASKPNTTQNCVISASPTVTIKFFGKSKVYSLFGNFRQYLTPNDNFTGKITLQTKDETLSYQVVSAYRFDITSNYYDLYSPCYYTDFENQEEFDTFYNIIKTNSAVDFNVNAEYGDKFLTLFASDTEDENYRIMIIAKQV